MQESMTYEAVHPDYSAYSSKWLLISDVLKGEEQIKAQGMKYLPLENMEGDAYAEQFVARYAAYKGRAVFYNATARTLAGFVGQVFDKPPHQEFPEALKYLQEDPCGSGVTLEQLAKLALAGTVSTGRAGLWADFPDTGGSYSVADIRSGEVRPTITYYPALDIRNWRTIKRKARTLLSLVVLRERVEVEEANNYFLTRYEYRYRVLRLEDNVYTVTVYDPWSAVQKERKYIPTDVDGNTFNEIPFTFIGIAENDSSVDEPPMYDLASLNIAHYRNSADYEDACFMVGQPTVWYSGLDKNWIENVLKGTFRLGSRGGLPLPPGGNAGLLQVASNTMTKEAMDQKEAQMVALGARIVRDPSVAKTATEVNSDKVTEVSTLASGARNVSAALRKAFEYAQKFTGTSLEVKFELSTDFDMVRMTSQEILALVTTWQAKLLTTTETRDVLTRAGYAALPMDKAAAEGVAKEAPEPVATGAARTDNRAAPEGGSSV